ncbi:Carbohydrate binding domain-containing protein [Ruminococcus sp. YRD2003]|uniref:family 43 glycosylhydrolase n=1 Tax=Ruminococcus sp. YRD2003 TaxID=1452313 RepID=UPI0008D21903|nr:Carbohydrate binding domain-containing protein [Ruminococcus flavefaciens]
MKRIIKAAALALISAATMCVAAPAVTNAENPIVQTSFTPDPAPVVFGDELWVYTGCDRDGQNSFYTMTGWQAFSTKDMKNWTDHGKFLNDNDFSWCSKDNAWASQCIERNGKYYFYFTTTTNGRAIGVGVADKPEGPYKDVLGKPLCGPNWDYIDPTVMIDDDGQAWLMFGNPRCYYVKLKEDMITLDGPIKSFDMTKDAFGVGKQDPQRTGTAYGEGPWICKHDNLYYLVFAGFYQNQGGESICYSYGPSVTGPWKFGAQITPESNCFTTHGGIIDYKGHSYLFYHKNGLKGGGTFKRSAAVEEFTFNSDGTIPMVKPTNEGPAQLEPLNPFERVEAETICWSEGVKSENCSEGGINIGSIKNGSYIKVAGVDFGQGAEKFTACAAANGSGGTIELHLDKKDGPKIGECAVTGTGGWQNWQEFSCDVSAEGEHDLYFVFTGGNDYLMNFDWWQFEGAGSASQSDPTYIFKSTFENGLDGWSDRGGATVSASTDEAYDGEGSVYVSDRSASWKGVGKKLNYKFKAGESYSFSANVKYTEGAPSVKFHFTLQYDDASGETQYVKIDSMDVPKGEWAQLANTSFKIPEGAKNPLIYVETEGDSDDETPATNFYVDDIFAAIDGTEIEGAGKPAVVEEPVTPGDLNFDEKVDSFDVILARQTLILNMNDGGQPIDKKVLRAADVDESGSFKVNDLIQLLNFTLGKTKSFGVNETDAPAPTGASADSVQNPVFIGSNAFRKMGFIR